MGWQPAPPARAPAHQPPSTKYFPFKCVSRLRDRISRTDGTILPTFQPPPKPRPSCNARLLEHNSSAPYGLLRIATAMSTNVHESGAGAKRSNSRTRTSRPTTPLRPSSRSSFRDSARSVGDGDAPFPLNAFEPAFAELTDAMADLEANMMHFQLMHESLARFSESFASFLYGLNMNAFCVDFPEVRIFATPARYLPPAYKAECIVSRRHQLTVNFTGSYPRVVPSRSAARCTGRQHRAIRERRRGYLHVRRAQTATYVALSPHCWPATD